MNKILCQYLLHKFSLLYKYIDTLHKQLSFYVQIVLSILIRSTLSHFTVLFSRFFLSS